MREPRMVPEPEFTSYYGRPILKQPVWKQPDVPAYLFVGGLAGASAVLAEGAALTGRPRLRRVARLAAAAGSTLGAGALMHDLGRPERFLNMLRMLKVTSPLSVGSWILASFSTLAGGRQLPSSQVECRSRVAWPGSVPAFSAPRSPLTRPR